MYDEWDVFTDSDVGKSEPTHALQSYLSSPIDFLELSCLYYRTNKESTGSDKFVHLFNIDYANEERELSGNKCRLTTALDLDGLPALTKDDVELANTIRDYYKKKLLVKVLKDKKLTEFEEDLHRFLYQEPYSIKESYMGLVSKLPYFYHYDIQLDEMFQDSTSPDYGIKTNIMRLTFLKKLYPNRRKNQLEVEYWCKNVKNIITVLPIDECNPLLPLFEKAITDGIVVGGIFGVHVKNNMRFYKPHGHWIITNDS